MADNNRRLILYDGIKSSILWDEETNAWNYLSNSPIAVNTGLYRTIPVLYRGISVISDAATKVPFSIYKGENEYDTSDDWGNKVGVFPNPRKLFWLISQSLDRYGCAYLLKTQNKAKYPKELKWLAPSTIEPVLDEKNGLVEFTRTIGTKTIQIPVDEMIYFWLPDSDVEVGPPMAWPLKSALSAAGVLGNLNEFITKYFERGAIRPLIVTTKNMPNKDERERMESWLNRLMGGIKRAFTWKVFNADTMDFQQIGDGLDQLQNQTLTEDQRSDVALALGIPQTILFASAANYATSLSDQRNFYDMTIVPRVEFIASTFNEQLLEPMKLHLDFDPNSLDMYQEDEKERSQSLSAYVTAGFSLLMACDVLGIDLTDEQRAELEAEKAAKEERAQEMAELARQKPEEEPENVTTTQPPQFQARSMSGDMRSELSKWYKVSSKALRAGKPQPEFESIIIPPGLHGAISGALEEAKEPDDVKRVFADLFQEH